MAIPGFSAEACLTAPNAAFRMGRLSLQAGATANAVEPAGPAAGFSMPQCAVVGRPGQIGHAAALSQTEVESVVVPAQFGRIC